MNFEMDVIPERLLDKDYLLKVVSLLDKEHNTDGQHIGVACYKYSTGSGNHCGDCILSRRYINGLGDDRDLCNYPIPIQEKVAFIAQLVDGKEYKMYRALSELNR